MRRFAAASKRAKPFARLEAARRRLPPSGFRTGKPPPGGSPALSGSPVCPLKPGARVNRRPCSRTGADASALSRECSREFESIPDSSLARGHGGFHRAVACKPAAPLTVGDEAARGGHASARPGRLPAGASTGPAHSRKRTRREHVSFRGAGHSTGPFIFDQYLATFEMTSVLPWTSACLPPRTGFGDAKSAFSAEKTRLFGRQERVFGCKKRVFGGYEKSAAARQLRSATCLRRPRACVGSRAWVTRLVVRSRDWSRDGSA